MNTPKTMSEALFRAAKDKRVIVARGTYLSSMDLGISDKANTESKRIYACGVGAIVSQILPNFRRRTLMKAGGRSSIIEMICKKIKGSCDIVPEEILNKYDLEQDINHYDINADNWRWIDFVEFLFMKKRYGYERIGKILQKYNK